MLSETPGLLDSWTPGRGLVFGSLSELASGSHSDAKVVMRCFIVLAAEKGSCSVAIESITSARLSQHRSDNWLVSSW